MSRIMSDAIAEISQQVVLNDFCPSDFATDSFSFSNEPEPI
jgi:hypothetical protein